MIIGKEKFLDRLIHFSPSWEVREIYPKFSGGDFDFGETIWLIIGIKWSKELVRTTGATRQIVRVLEQNKIRIHKLDNDFYGVIFGNEEFDYYKIYNLNTSHSCYQEYLERMKFKSALIN